MRERVTRITVFAFRGVPGSFSVELPDGRSLAVFGDNGTGKSTIADALEWYFTGRLELLRHEGRAHAIRHLGALADSVTSVEVETTGSSGGRIEYPDGAAPAFAQEVASRETFLLRGRTLVAFVDKSKSEKWKALAEILGLDDVDQLRLELQRARNELRDAATEATREVEAHARALDQWVSDISSDGILVAIRERCSEAGIEAPDTIEAALDVEWSRNIIDGSESNNRAVLVASLGSEIRAQALAVAEDRIRAWNELLSEGHREQHLLLRLLRAGDSYLDGVPSEDRCPLCGQATDIRELARQIRDTLERLREDVETLDHAREGVRGVVESIESAVRRATSFLTRAQTLGVQLPPIPQPLRFPGR